jgi:hypothetical protein
MGLLELAQHLPDRAAADGVLGAAGEALQLTTQADP